MNKWPDDDVEEVDKIRDHMRGTYANRTICKFRVSWTDEDHNTWDEATGLGKDAPILVAKYLDGKTFGKRSKLRRNKRQLENKKNY